MESSASPPASTVRAETSNEKNNAREHWFAIDTADWIIFFVNRDQAWLFCREIERFTL